jgi:hypothetical protein
MESERVEMTVDDQLFVVTTDPAQQGTHHFEWVSGPNKGYGFTAQMSTREPMTRADMEQAIRNFLVQVDPTTGYIE